MDVNYINPFIQAASNVFKTVLGCDIERSDLMLKDSNTPTFDVSAVIGFTGKANGAVVFSVSSSVAFMATEIMLETEVREINADVVDAVGELANMIAGGAKTGLSNYKMSLGLPSVVVGAVIQSDFRRMCGPSACCLTRRRSRSRSTSDSIPAKSKPPRSPPSSAPPETLMNKENDHEPERAGCR